MDRWTVTDRYHAPRRAGSLSVSRRSKASRTTACATSSASWESCTRGSRCWLLGCLAPAEQLSYRLTPPRWQLSKVENEVCPRPRGPNQARRRRAWQAITWVS